jgi:hypothetical protein
MAHRTGFRRTVSPIALALFFASAAPALADHEIERVEGPDWRLASANSTAIKIERTGGNSFAAFTTETAPNDCFRTGSLVYEFSGHEPEFTGSEYRSTEDMNGNCSGFERVPANFFVSWDSRQIHFSSIARDNEVLTWDKERVDTDGDGLFDDEERSGINVARNPGSFEPSFETEVDLRRMGADPNRKDLFVEVDSMAGHEMSPEAVSKVATAFADAPVSNPDGSRGISIHVDAGPGTLMDPRTGTTWGELSEFDTLPHAQTYGSDPDPFEQFEATKEAFFDECPPSGVLCNSARNLAFRYAVTVHNIGGVDGANGVADSAPGIGSINGFQCHEVRTECNMSFGDQAGLFMHEFGHNLGLDHGGRGDETNHKPNHFSVMNYNYSLGIPIRPGELYIDYSRWGPSEVPDLDEAGLDERQGVRVPADIGTVIGCQRTRRFRAFFANRAIDFNCDGRERGTVASDINLDRRRGVLKTANEWNSLTLNPRFLAQGLFPRRQAIPTAPIVETPDYFETRPLLYGDPKKPKLQVKSSGKGKQVKLKFKARDNKDLDRLIIDLGKPVDEYLEREPSKSKGPASLSARVPKGTKVGAVALDQAGNATEKRFRGR